ncbi:MAG TPA: FmdB family zinc ribbon protein [Burkholderiales bacterium]|nr:FmdB family zinc ribbon protein [Burkholderiales bacterium]
MPIYEYRCGECGFQKEFLQRMNDAPLSDCPECGKAALIKLLSAAGFQLKGTGWYVTDFRDNKSKSTGKPDKADKTDKTGKPAEAAKPAESSAKESAKTETSAAPPPAKTATEKV